MTENAKKFLEKASQDAALQAELQKAQGEAMIKVASAHGFNLTAEDLKASELKALSEDELKAVAGGSTCVCVVAGGGTGNLMCGCGFFGVGDAAQNHKGHCGCGGGGYGVNSD